MEPSAMNYCDCIKTVDSHQRLSRMWASALLWSALFVVQLGALPAQAADLMVAAAVSLTNAFTEIGKAYEKATPGTRVLFTFASSGQLLQQISRGAPVHVFASADLDTMDRAEAQRLIRRSSRVTFAANKLVLVVPGDSKLEISKLSDLTKPQVQRIALGTPEIVPAGRYAKGALEKADLWASLGPKFIFTQNVRQSLDYVFRGEVDAGFVYATDAATSPVKVRTALEVPLEEPILYPIAAVIGFGDEDRAVAFIAFVRSELGQAILAKYGFLKP
jgi:molybdate transport system substrate-binding protein